MSGDAVQAPETAVAAVDPGVFRNITMEDRIANTAANQANAVTGIYGISGAGKSAQADEAAVYAYETFGKITLCYVADLGGFGTKRLALIRAGIMRVWDPRNHVNAFETMELISLGAWPLKLADAETGYADPDVPLILPRRMTQQLICPNGHVAAKADSDLAWRVAPVQCPTCNMVTNLSNALRVDKTIVRHRLFRDVGMRIFDSFTAMNDWGMHELQTLSAAGKLPTSSTGGSALAGADALRSGQFSYSTGSKPQYGFMQNRTYAWLSNIKTIPDQVVPAIATFGVEASKSDDESGGELLMGPKIAGSARTSTLPFWLGNLIHATKEPRSVDDPTMVYRLWLTNHIDPRDPRKVPYVAKHRGTPLGMPEFLEDAPGAKPWSTCSLRHFFVLLNDQLAKEAAALAEQFPQTPGMWTGDDAPDADEVITTVAAGAGRAPSVGGSSTGVATTATPTVVAGGASRLRRPGAARSVAAPVAPVQTTSGPPAPVAVAAPAQVDAAATVQVPTETAAVVTGPGALGTSPIATPAPSVTTAPQTAAPAATPAATPLAPAVVTPPAQPASPPPPTVAPTNGGAPIAGAPTRRRLARPPV